MTRDQEDRPLRSDRGRRPVVGVATVVAAAVIIGLVVVAGTWLINPGRAGTGAGSTPSSVATPTSNPTLNASASPGPAKCRGADFAVSTDPWGGAAGSRGTIVVLRVVDSVTACQIGGALDGQITDSAGSVLVEARSDPTLASTVTAGTQLEIGVAWSNWCGPEPTRPLELSIMLPGDAAPVPLVPPAGTEILVPPCLGEGQPSSLSITSLQPLTTPPPEG